MSQERETPRSEKELSPFTATGRELICRAGQEACNVNSVNVDPGHLVMAACRTYESVAYFLLLQMGVSIKELYQKLEEGFKKENIPLVELVKSGAVLPDMRNIKLSDKAKVALELAANLKKQLMELMDSQINSGHLLLGCIQEDEREFYGGGFFKQFGITFDQAREVYLRLPHDQRDLEMSNLTLLDFLRVQRAQGTTISLVETTTQETFPVEVIGQDFVVVRKSPTDLLLIPYNTPGLKFQIQLEHKPKK